MHRGLIGFRDKRFNVWDIVETWSWLTPLPSLWYAMFEHVPHYRSSPLFPCSLLDKLLYAKVWPGFAAYFGSRQKRDLYGYNHYIFQKAMLLPALSHVLLIRLITWGETMQILSKWGDYSLSPLVHLIQCLYLLIHSSVLFCEAAHLISIIAIGSSTRVSSGTPLWPKYIMRASLPGWTVFAAK